MVKQFLTGLLCFGFLTVAANNLSYAVDTPVNKVTVSTPVEKLQAGVSDDLGSLLKTLVDSVKNHQGRAIAASVLMLLLFLWRRFGSHLLIGKVPTKWMPLLTAGVAVLAALPSALTSAGFSWGSFLTNGLLLGAEAMALWSVLGKLTLPKLFGEVPSQPVAEVVVVAEPPKPTDPVEPPVQ